MSYSKDHSRKNPLAPSRMYGLSSSASTSTTPIDNEPIVTTERTTRGGVEGTLTTKEVKPRQSKLPKVGMEEAYDRALKLGYRDENETLEEFTIRANKFNEGSSEESFVEDEKKQEKTPLKPVEEVDRSRPAILNSHPSATLVPMFVKLYDEILLESKNFIFNPVASNFCRLAKLAKGPPSLQLAPLVDKSHVLISTSNNEVQPKNILPIIQPES